MMTETLLVRGGRLLAPADGYQGLQADILIRKGRIVRIDKRIKMPRANVLSLSGEFVSPGFIDAHGHFDPDNPLGIGLHHDLAGVGNGNSTVIDAGSTGASNFPNFRRRWMGRGQTRLFALLNLAKNGIDTWEEASHVSNFDFAMLKEVAAGNREQIVGLKIRCDREAVGDLGIWPYQEAQKMARTLSLPLVVHIGEAGPEIEEILLQAEKGDILTHCYNSYHPNGIWNSLTDESLQIRPKTWEARRRGVLFDVGHGGCSFSFAVGQAMMEQGFYPDIISTDIYTWNYLQPVRGLWNVMTKMLMLGLPLERCVSAVTSTPADTFSLNGLGHLQEGNRGDLTIFQLEDAPIELTDSCGEKRLCNCWIHPKYAVVAGNIYRSCISC